MNTALGRLLIIGRDTSSAACALTNLHRCLAKIEDRAVSLKSKGSNIDSAIAAMRAAEYLACAKRMLGVCLGELDKVTAAVETERKRYTLERRLERERRNVR